MTGGGLAVVTILLVMMELLEDKLPADFAWIAAGVIFLDAIMIIVLGNTLCKRNSREVRQMKIRRGKLDMILNLLCLILLIRMTLWLPIFWDRIPDQVPMHYDFAGNINRWGKSQRCCSCR